MPALRTWNPAPRTEGIQNHIQRKFPTLALTTASGYSRTPWRTSKKPSWSITCARWSKMNKKSSWSSNNPQARTTAGLFHDDLVHPGQMFLSKVVPPQTHQIKLTNMTWVKGHVPQVWEKDMCPKLQAKNPWCRQGLAQTVPHPSGAGHLSQYVPQVGHPAVMYPFLSDQEAQQVRCYNMKTFKLKQQLDHACKSFQKNTTCLGFVLGSPPGGEAHYADLLGPFHPLVHQVCWHLSTRVRQSRVLHRRCAALTWLEQMHMSSPELTLSQKLKPEPRDLTKQCNIRPVK